MTAMNAKNYAGDVTPRQAWETLRDEPDAVLVDVRTRPEWAFVGIPDLNEAGKETVLLEWQAFPTMDIAPDFADQLGAILAERGADADSPVFFICRSGARSQSAAQAMTSAGFKRCYNVAGGFEGRLDGVGHRGTLDGWKVDGLPWKQS